MSDLEDLPGRLASQMHTATAADIAPPDLLERVHRAAARRRHRNAGALAMAAIAAGVAVVALPTPERSPEPERLAGPTSPASDLSVVRSDSGRLGGSVTVDGELREERVELPGYLRNNADQPVTVLSMTVPGTGLQAQFPEQLTLVPGGKVPLTLTRSVDCDTGPALPAQFDLRVAVAGQSGPTSVLLPLPEEVVALYRVSHACSPERRVADEAEARARAAEEARRQAEKAAQPPSAG